MNTYARMREPRGGVESTGRTRAGERGNAGNVWRIALPVIGIVFLVCGACLLRVYFKAKTESLTRQTAILENLIKTQKQELACLRNREAQFTTRSHVMGKLRHAGLRAPEYGQVTHVALITPESQFRSRSSAMAEYSSPAEKEKNIAAAYSLAKRR